MLIEDALKPRPRKTYPVYYFAPGLGIFKLEYQFYTLTKAQEYCKKMNCIKQEKAGCVLVYDCFYFTSIENFVDTSKHAVPTTK